MAVRTISHYSFFQLGCNFVVYPGALSLQKSLDSWHNRLVLFFVPISSWPLGPDSLIIFPLCDGKNMYMGPENHCELFFFWDKTCYL